MEADLKIELLNRRPVELLDLTASFNGLGQEYLRYIQAEHPEDAASDVRLYVQEIRPGSILASLAAISPQLMQGVSYANSVVSFAKHLKGAYDHLTGIKDLPKVDLSKPALQNLAQIVEPVAKDAGSQLNIGTVNGNVVFNINSQEANAAQNTINRLLRQEPPSSTIHEKVLLYWYQARAEAGNRAGDKGIIESISPEPVRVICATDDVKRQMVLSAANPFKEAFVVDVVVETMRAKPALYKIIRLHDRFERD